jgi:hypothetical protein
VSTPITTPAHSPDRGIGSLACPGAELPDWEDNGAAADWDSADWDPAELADWEPEDPEEEPPEPAMPEPETSDLRGDGGWFSAGGVADKLRPGPRLAGFIADARAIGLGRLTDDELIGMMRAARRLASWSAAMELAATGDLWRRRWTEDQDGATGAARDTDDEIAAALTLTRRAADQVLSLAIALRRLPLTSQALTAGDIDMPRAMVIADEVTGLGNEHATAVEQIVIGAAAGQTTGQLRAAARRAVLAADPQAARRRKERALQDARVERWDEHGGTAALAGRDLPPASVLAADQNLSALARQLKRAGASGTLDQLRAQVYLALLTGNSVGSLTPTGPGTASGLSPSDSSRGFPGLAGDSPGGTTAPGFCPPARPSALGGPGTRSTPASPGAPASPGITGISSSGITGIFGGHGTSASPGIPASSGAFSASGTVNLTLPLASWLGLSDAPGNVAGFGALDAVDSRAIATALSARADTKWCLTLTDSQGRPVAHGCARAGPPPSQLRVEWPTGPPGAQKTSPRDGSAGGTGDRPPDGPHDRPAAGFHDRSAGSPHDRSAGSPHDRSAGSPHDGPADSPRDGPADSPRDGPAGGPHDGPADSPRDGPRAGAPGKPDKRAHGEPDTRACSEPDIRACSEPDTHTSGEHDIRASSEPVTRAFDRTWTFSLTFLAGGDCDHARETAAYRPSPALRHLIEIRHATCTYPGCRRSAARCDADHTVAYHRGGRTCLCNLAMLCRHHHEVKQSPGWRLDQASPGVMTWTTPAGRRYSVGQSSYPD